MRTLFQTLMQFAWALWLGGLIAVLLSVWTLFHNDHALAAQAAPQIFHAFEPYQCALAAAAVIFSAAARRPVLFALFIVASIGSAVSPLWITPHISQLQLQGLTHTPEFAKAHGLSMMIYSTDTLLLIIAGLLMPLRPRRTIRAIVPA